MQRLCRPHRKGNLLSLCSDVQMGMVDFWISLVVPEGREWKGWRAFHGELNRVVALSQLSPCDGCIAEPHRQVKGGVSIPERLAIVSAGMCKAGCREIGIPMYAKIVAGMWEILATERPSRGSNELFVFKCH